MDALNQIWTQLQQQWAARAPREQRLLLAAAAVVVLTLFYLLLWEPAATARAEALQALRQSRDVAQEIEELAALRPRGGASAAADRSRSLLALVDQAARSGTLGKAPERLQPDGDDSVRVWVEEVELARLLRWMAELEQSGLAVVAADLERKAPGVASARLQVERGA